MEQPKKKSVFTPQELRIIAFSLSILSLGSAIALIGFFFLQK